MDSLPSPSSTSSSSSPPPPHLLTLPPELLARVLILAGPGATAALARTCAAAADRLAAGGSLESVWIAHARSVGGLPWIRCLPRRWTRDAVATRQRRWSWPTLLAAHAKGDAMLVRDVDGTSPIVVPVRELLIEDRPDGATLRGLVLARLGLDPAADEADEFRLLVASPGEEGGQAAGPVVVRRLLLRDENALEACCGGLRTWFELHAWTFNHSRRDAFLSSGSEPLVFAYFRQALASFLNGRLRLMSYTSALELAAIAEALRLAYPDALPTGDATPPLCVPWYYASHAAASGGRAWVADRAAAALDSATNGADGPTVGRRALMRLFLARARDLRAKPAAAIFPDCRGDLEAIGQGVVSQVSAIVWDRRLSLVQPFDPAASSAAPATGDGDGDPATGGAALPAVVELMNWPMTSIKRWHTSGDTLNLEVRYRLGMATIAIHSPEAKLIEDCIVRVVNEIIRVWPPAPAPRSTAEKGDDDDDERAGGGQAIPWDLVGQRIARQNERISVAYGNGIQGPGGAKKGKAKKKKKKKKAKKATGGSRGRL